MYNPSRKNKGADQPCNYCTADLCLCFRLGNNPVFSGHSSFVSAHFFHDELTNAILESAYKEKMAIN